jgi:hypothetical protein
MKESLAVDAVIEQEVDKFVEEQKQAEAHRYHMEYKSYCVWCRRSRS